MNPHAAFASSLLTTKQPDHGVNSPWFWMRSAGFTWDTLEAFKALPEGKAQQQLHELLAHLQTLQNLQAQVQQQVCALSPEALPKVQRRFLERQALAAADLPLVVRAAVADALEQRRILMQAIAPMAQALEAEFYDVQHTNRVRLAQCFLDAKLREAVFMSNPEALKRMDDLLGGLQEKAKPAMVLDSRSRQRLRLAWNYLQRFCAKNDTASFFGPMVWGRWSAQLQTPVQLAWGQTPLAKRHTFIEHWVVHGIAQAIAQDPDLWPELPLHLSPSCDLRGSTLHYPVGKSLELQGWALQWVAALHANRCQSETISFKRMLAKNQMDETQTLPFKQQLDTLIAKGVVLRGVWVAPGACQPLQQFRDCLHSMQSPKRYDWLEWLDDVERQVQRYAHADLVHRIESLASLCAVLQAMGVNTDRLAGAMYVGRFPVYEDCLRGLDISLGQPLLHSLKQSLVPILKLYDWLMGAIVVRVQDAWLQQTALCKGDAVDFLAFYTQTRKLDLQAEVVKPLRQVLCDAWAKILGPHANLQEHVLHEHDFIGLMQHLHTAEPRALEAAQGLWRVHSPDVMLAASSLASLNQGQFQWVLGELHPGVHTVSQPVALPFCPWLDEVLQEVEAMLKPGTVVVADSDAHYQRSHIDWPLVPSLHQVALPGATPKVPPQRVWHAGQLQVVYQEQGLHLKHLDHGYCQPLLMALPTDVHRCAFELAADAVGYAWAPRLVYRNFILKRRSWVFSGEDLPAKGILPSENWQSYLDWQLWRIGHGMPEHVFVKIQNEPKPILLDYTNPLSLDLLVNLSKQAVFLRFSEMRPSPSELWLADSAGRYCSEFRTAFMPQSLFD